MLTICTLYCSSKGQCPRMTLTALSSTWLENGGISSFRVVGVCLCTALLKSVVWMQLYKPNKLCLFSLFLIALS